MIVKTSAIVLRRHPYTETSLVVTWLTPDAGRINTLIKGAFRPKSPFLGEVDLFYTCELLYYGRHPDGLPVTREVAALNPRARLRTDWRACAVASYLCSLISRATPPQATRAAVFNWLENGLDSAARDGGSALALFRHEVRLLHLLGLSPRIAGCLDCGKPVPSSAEVFFSPREGGWWCAACAPDPRREEIIRAPPDAVRLIAIWHRSAGPDAPPSEAPGFAALDAVERMLGAFMLHHLDISPGPRAAALDILSRKPARPVDRDPALR